MTAPVTHGQTQKGKFTRVDFAYDRDRDLYICPGGKELKTSGTVYDGTTIKYLAKRSVIHLRWRRIVS